MKLLAQNLILPGPSGTGVPIAGPTQITGQFNTLGDVVTKLLPLLYTLAGLILFIMLIWGGFDLVFSGGDQNKMTSAKGKITAAVIGFILVFVAYWLTQLISYIFGIKPL